MDQLQNALDSLKHNVAVDQAVIKRIRSEVPKTPWRDAKEARRISQMPMDVPVCGTDIVGQLYNYVRKEIGVLFEETLPLRDFGGMIRGETFTREMHEECVKVNRAFGIKASELRTRTEQFEAALKEAQVEFERLRKDDNPQVRQQASKNLYRAKAALRANEERCREEMRHFHRWLLEWGNGKRENRRGWCQALHSIAVHRETTRPPAPSSFTLSRRKWSTRSSGRPADNPYGSTSRKCRMGRSFSTSREMYSGSSGSNSQTVKSRSDISSCSG